MTDLRHTVKELDDFSKAVIQTARRNLNALRANASGNLSKSLEGKIRHGKNEVKLDFLMESYGIARDEGRGKTRKSGNGEVRKAIAEWVKVRKVRPRNEQGQFIPNTPENIESMAYAIARSIHEKGYKGNKFFSSSFEKHARNLSKELQEAYATDIREALDKVIKDIKTD